MLGKMIKYDLMFGARKYAFMAALTAALLVIAIAASRLSNDLVLGLSIFFAVIATVTYGIMYVVISVRHLATQLCSKESYLQYALPASTHTLVLSKLICIAIWGVVTSLLMTFFWLVGIGGVALAQSEISLADLWQMFIGSLDYIGVRAGAVFTTVGAIGLTSWVMALALLGFCVALTNVPFLKERGLGVVTGVVGFFVLNFGLSAIITRIGGAFIRLENTPVVSDFAINTEISSFLQSWTIYLSIAQLLVGIGFYFLTAYTVKRHKFIG